MPSNFELKQKARQAIYKAVPNACIVSLVFFILSWVLNYLDQQISGAQVILDTEEYLAGNLASAMTVKPPQYTVIGVILSIAIYFVVIILHYGFSFYTLDITRGKKAGVMNLLDGFAVWWKAILLNLLMMLFVMLWSLLLIVPGIIALFRYSMAVFLLRDHPDWSPMQCIRESSRLMKGQKGRLFSLHLSFLGWYILTLIPATSVYVNPYVGCAKAEFYDRLIGYSETDPVASEDKKPWEY